jgi:DNA polymerase III subunit epsilon
MELKSLSYAVVDVETTGTWANGGDRIMEVAVIHVRDGEITTATDLLVNPQRPVARWVSRLTGIRWDMLHEAPTFGDIADRVRESLDGHVFVAHNARFDWRFVSGELRRATGVGLKGSAPRLCTLKLARRLLSHLPRRNLDALAWHYDVEIIGRHRAGGDARATARILWRMLADARRQDIDTWDQLQAFMRAPRPERARSALPQPVREEAVA